jgi:large subunit ribosomal protein L5
VTKKLEFARAAERKFKYKTMIPLRDKIKQTQGELKKTLGISNVMALPRLTKAVISTGVGKQKDKKKLEQIADRLAKISGQKSTSRGAKKSVASFKTREGDIVGMAVTLRGERMYGFLDKLINVAIPRMRDFRGIDSKVVDDMGNMTMGIKEHTIFPETADEDLRDVFGLAVTITTTAKDKKTATEFFKVIGIPFKKK